MLYIRLKKTTVFMYLIAEQLEFPDGPDSTRCPMIWRSSVFPTLSLAHSLTSVFNPSAASTMCIWLYWISNKMHLGKIEVFILRHVMITYCATDFITLNVGFLRRQSSPTASRDLHLLTSRKSHTNMNESIGLSLTHTYTHHSSLACIFFTGEGTHSPQSGYVQPSPTTAPHRLSDLSTFPHILGSHKPFSTLLWSFPGWAAASSGLNGTRPNLDQCWERKKKNPFECGLPLLLQTLIWKYFGTVLFYRTDAHIFKIHLYIYIFSMSIFVPLIVLVIFK